MLTVTAGTTDRAIRTTERLGNGQEFHGESLFQPRNNTAGRPLPLVFPEARDCSALVEAEVRGKVVLCESRSISEHVEQGQTVAAYGGPDMVLMNKAAEGYTIFADAHVLAASHVSHAAGSRIASCAKSAPRPTASIAFRGTVMGLSSAPSVAFFSRPQEETEKQEMYTPTALQFRDEGEAKETRIVPRRRMCTRTVNGGRRLIPVYAALSVISYLFWSLSVACVSKTEKPTPTPPFRRIPLSFLL
jgi:hypothetical protein